MNMIQLPSPPSDQTGVHNLPHPAQASTLKVRGSTVVCDQVTRDVTVYSFHAQMPEALRHDVELLLRQALRAGYAAATADMRRLLNHGER
jgi:hypothetical protein